MIGHLANGSAASASGARKPPDGKLAAFAVGLSSGRWLPRRLPALSPLRRPPAPLWRMVAWHLPADLWQRLRRPTRGRDHSPACARDHSPACARDHSPACDPRHNPRCGPRHSPACGPLPHRQCVQVRILAYGPPRSPDCQAANWVTTRRLHRPLRRLPVRPRPHLLETASFPAESWKTARACLGKNGSDPLGLSSARCWPAPWHGSSLTTCSSGPIKTTIATARRAISARSNRS